MFNQIIAAFAVVFVDPEELSYKGRSLHRVWFAAMLALMLGLSCLRGVVNDI